MERSRMSFGGSGRMSSGIVRNQTHAITQQQQQPSQQQQGVPPKSGVGCYPVLNTGEIIMCLAEFGIQLTKEDITRPKGEVVMQVYDQFVEGCMGAARANVVQPEFAALEGLQFPDLHESSLPELVWMNALRLLMETAGVPDLSLNDVVQPDYQRTRRLLSAVINFFKFRQGHVNEYDQFISDNEKLEREREELEQYCREVRAELDAYKQRFQQEKPLAEQLSEEVGALAQEITALNNKQAAMHQEVRKVKDSAKDIADATASERVKLMSAKQSVAKLQSQIVQSPQRMRSLLGDMTNRLADEREVVVESERRARELLVKLDSMDSVESDISKASKMMKDARADMAGLEEAVKHSEQVQDNVAAQNLALKNLTAKDTLTKRQLNATHEKLARLQRQSEFKLDAAQQAWDEAQAARSLIEEERRQAQDTIRQNEAMARTTEQKAKALHREHEAEMLRIRADYAALQQQVETFHGNLLRAMQPQQQQQQPSSSSDEAVAAAAAAASPVRAPTSAVTRTPPLA